RGLREAAGAVALEVVAGGRDRRGRQAVAARVRGHDAGGGGGAAGVPQAASRSGRCLVLGHGHVPQRQPAEVRDAAAAAGRGVAGNRHLGQRRDAVAAVGDAAAAPSGHLGNVVVDADVVEVDVPVVVAGAAVDVVGGAVEVRPSVHDAKPL